jgi:phosphatidylglycerophosphate synthase
MAVADLNRRPLKTRSARWAQRVAGLLVSTNISPDQISLLSIVVAAIGAGALLLGRGPCALVACAVCIQLRLACNMLDGMVAVEGGKKSPVGSLYNEIPDRLADSIFIVAVGYAVHIEWLGWCAALLAALTAYIRVLGGSLGFAQDFRGPLAKPHRMFALTLGCLFGAAEQARWGTQYALTLALALIAAGSAVTCATRTRAIAISLRARQP